MYGFFCYPPNFYAINFNIYAQNFSIIFFGSVISVQLFWDFYLHRFTFSLHCFTFSLRYFTCFYMNFFVAVKTKTPAT